MPVSVGAQTKNSGELLAFLHVLRTVDRSSPLLIVVDSTYVANGACLWLLGWQASDWRTGSKQVANVDLWAEVAKNLQSRAPVSVLHVYSHIGFEGNEQADLLAKKAVRLHVARRGLILRPEPAVSRRQYGTTMASLVKVKTLEDQARHQEPAATDTFCYDPKLLARREVATAPARQTQSLGMPPQPTPTVVDLTHEADNAPKDRQRIMAELDELDDEELEGRYQTLRRQYIQSRRRERQQEAAAAHAVSSAGPTTPSLERMQGLEKEGTPEPDAFQDFV